ncbi:MAG: hypothetical protein NTW87_24485 [Planctomycetota bacterium]|nr:hypothetical protein [Planctomycetota bacterium]
MIAIAAHYDGKYIVPDEPVNVPRDKPLKVQIELAEARAGTREYSALDWIGDNAVDDPSLPHDLAANHDHYLYGTPKKEP